MKVWFIHHSSFLVETASRYLLFDYVKGMLPDLDAQKPLWVFASHRHRDHFSERVFELERRCANIRYILSDDIFLRRVPEGLRDRTVMVGPNQDILMDEMRVETLCSTDQGVAFLLTVDGIKVYHAGDLNDWYWEGEPAREQERMGKAYEAEIQKLKGKKIDLAFVVLDPRQEHNYDRGIRYFLEHVAAERILPMHCWGDETIVTKLKNETWAKPYREHILDIPPGKSIQL